MLQSGAWGEAGEGLDDGRWGQEGVILFSL